jgi:HPt (histidine-containing phosphotransfer) domain-containing protein
MDYKFIKTDYLESVSGGDRTLIKELTDMFREQMIEMQSEMIALLAEKNYHSLGLLAHKAKSSVAIMGMEELSEMLKTFELQVKASEAVELYDSYVSRFVHDTKEAISELDDLLNNN